MNIPDPLHPAIVHFPIAFIIFGTAVAVTLLFLPRPRLAQLCLVLFAFGAAGSIAATWSGDHEEEAVEHTRSTAEQVFEEHEEWGERSRNAAISALLGALGTVVAMKRFPRVGRTMAGVTTALALASSWCVITAGHYGGLLVYQHGVGVKAAGTALPTAAQATRRHHNHHGDD